MSTRIQIFVSFSNKTAVLMLCNLVLFLYVTSRFKGEVKENNEMPIDLNSWLAGIDKIG